MSRNRKAFPEKELLLKNGKGEELTVILRERRPGDEEGMIACIRDEYGETYFKRDFYHKEYLAAEADSGHITFLVAQNGNGGIAGMMILKEFLPEETMCEIASQIFRKKYRGYGLAAPFFQYGLEILKSRNYSAAYCLPVLFHDITQRLLYREGLRAAGVILNVFDLSRIVHSYDNGRNSKHSQGIQIMALGKTDAGKLYLPSEHIAFCRNIYDTLGVSYKIKYDEKSVCGNGKRGKLLRESDISHKQDKEQKSLEISVHRIGKDLPKRLKKLHEKYPLTGKQTANIFLNINDKNAVWAYRRLTASGYFFTGLKPLCSKREYMVLHHRGEVEVYTEDYVVSDEFRELLRAVHVK